MRATEPNTGHRDNKDSECHLTDTAASRPQAPAEAGSWLRTHLTAYMSQPNKEREPNAQNHPPITERTEEPGNPPNERQRNDPYGQTQSEFSGPELGDEPATTDNGYPLASQGESTDAAAGNFFAALTRSSPQENGGAEEGLNGNTPTYEPAEPCPEAPLHRELLDIGNEQGSAIRSDRPATGTHTSHL